jgi:3,4-dehydroadipyl-CoA semialdehyde dehydrogenase
VLIGNRQSAKSSTGHGSPLPVLVHGGPGRAGGGEEMGGIRDGQRASLVHEHEVFGPVSTLLGYQDAAGALALAHRGHGSLVASVFSADHAWLAQAGRELAGSHGRVNLVSPDVGKTQTGHGNVMPQSIHGGPGRAGGGEELGGLRALGFYHRRCALQASSATLERLGPAGSL